MFTPIIKNTKPEGHYIFDHRSHHINYSSVLKSSPVYLQIDLCTCVILEYEQWLNLTLTVAFLFQNDELRENAATYFIEISQVLNSIPRQMLLIMKTNDVLRGIEAALQTRSNASSFINMSKCCIRALGREKLKNCDSHYQTVRTRSYTQWQLCRIQLYEFILWIRSSALARWFKGNKQVTASWC
jgi:hypothetical protein